MLRHSCGDALANRGHDTRLIQDHLGHENVQHTVRYTRTAAALHEGADALMVFGDRGFFHSHRARLAELAFTHRLPSMFNDPEFVEAGGLMSYGPSAAEQKQRLTAYVDKLLKGPKPGDLPIEQPMTLEFVINLKTAQALGLTIPPPLLFQATEVIR
jgi:putative tryptophan/tyrosine transport system substrate-binding protein